MTRIRIIELVERSSYMKFKESHCKIIKEKRNSKRTWRMSMNRCLLNKRMSLTSNCIWDTRASRNKRRRETELLKTTRISLILTMKMMKK